MRNHRIAEGLRESRRVVCPVQKVRQRGKRVAAADGLGKGDRQAVVQEIRAHPERMRAVLVGDVIDQLVQLVEPPGRRAGKRPERSHSRNGDGRSEGIVDRRLEAAVRDLPAGFIDGARRKSGDVTDGQRLVQIVQSGGGAQSAGSARVITVDVIQTIAGGELFLLGELVVHFRQEVGIVNRIRKKSGGNPRSTVAHGVQT